MTLGGKKYVLGKIHQTSTARSETPRATIAAVSDIGWRTMFGWDSPLYRSSPFHEARTLSKAMQMDIGRQISLLRNLNIVVIVRSQEARSLSWKVEVELKVQRSQGVATPLASHRQYWYRRHVDAMLPFCQIKIVDFDNCAFDSFGKYTEVNCGGFCEVLAGGCGKSLTGV